jgi:hypothetical protein
LFEIPAPFAFRDWPPGIREINIGKTAQQLRLMRFGASE